MAAACKVAGHPALLRGFFSQVGTHGRFLCMPSDLKNLLNSWKFCQSSKLSSSSKTPHEHLPGSHVWWKALVQRRAHKQMAESFTEWLHSEMTPELNRGLMKLLEEQCSVFSAAPVYQEGSVCCTCLSPGAGCKLCCMCAVQQHYAWWQLYE